MAVIERALITGGSGFVGTAIVNALSKKHPQCLITIVDTKPPTDKLGGNVRYLTGDTTILDDLVKACKAAQPQVVIHSAAIIPPLSERYGRRLERLVFEVNIEGTRNALDAARNSGCTSFVYTSSCCAVTDDMSESYMNIDERWPVSPKSSIYGESKVQAEALVLAANGMDMSTCVLRPSVIFGKGDVQLIPSIHACLAKKETPWIVGDGTNLWDIVYVENVADAHVLAAENLVSSKTAAGEIFFIQNNEPISFREFSLEIWKNFGHIPPFEFNVPQSVAWFMGLLAEWKTFLTGTPTTLSRGSVRDACSMRYASGEKAKRILGYEPRVGIEEGIRLSCLDYSRRLAERKS